MKTETLFSHKTDVWETPEYLFKALDAEFHFTTDVCAVKENAKCDQFYTPEMDGLKQEWTGVCWCNPPYGRDIWKWMKKAYESDAKYLPENATLGSLFDGIGGFPLCWERIHGTGTARWASEIEEFPIAVTKLRFKEE